MASGAVFGTYELLERILLHLPVKDLVLSQRVTKGWRDLVQRSHGIRQALFLDDSHETGAHRARSDRSTDLWRMGSDATHESERGVRPLINPLLSEFFIND